MQQVTQTSTVALYVQVVLPKEAVLPQADGYHMWDEGIRTEGEYMVYSQ